MTKQRINISNKTISDDSPTFIIAELSANHNQQFNVAADTILAAKEAGADAIKIQTYTADTITLDCDNEYFQIKQGTLWDGKTLHQLYKEAYTPWEWQPELKRIAEDAGLVFFSSPFDPTAVDFLEEINVPAYKIASFEITDIPLIEYIASKGKPVFISTGIATLSDIEEALNACKRMNNEQVILLKCTSSYPAPLHEANLNIIPDLKKRFNVIAGLSDHTIGNVAAVTAVALGARVIEKHFIIDKKIGGPDAAFSVEPAEFKKMVSLIRDVEKALGKADYELSDLTLKSRNFARSLFVTRDIKKGEIFSNENVRSVRPGYGMHPKFLSTVLGKKAARDVEHGMPLSPDMIAGM